MAFQAQASNNNIDVKIYEALPGVTNTIAYKGLKDLAYAPGNAKPETPEPTSKNKGVKILTPPGKGNTNSETSAGTGSLTTVLLAY